MKTLLLTLLMLAATGTVNDKTGIDSTKETYVYICTGPQSKKYHKTKGCRGLNRCSASIIQISLSKAKSMGRGPCGICY